MSKEGKANKPKLTVEEFVKRGVRTLSRRKLELTKKFNSCHAVYDGLNEAFTEYFGMRPYEEDAQGNVTRDVYGDLAKKGVIGMHMVKGGPLLWNADEEPKVGTDTKAKSKGHSALVTDIVGDK